MLFNTLRWALPAFLFSYNAVAAITIDTTNEASIKAAAAIAARDMVSFYTGDQPGQIPGKLPGTWWEGGAMFDALIRYWHFTGDSTYNNITIQGMLWQAGAGDDYMPANWSAYLGNDDQVFWGLAAMTAAEVNFPTNPGAPSWLGLAQGVLNTQAPRWDDTSCGGGLRWQINPYQAGYTLKNSVSNGGFFQLAARLAVYTQNTSYSDLALKMWDWSTSSILVNTSSWYIIDATTTSSNCTYPEILQWTYNYGIYMMGCAYMYNYTNGDTTWSTALDGFMGTMISTFFPTAYGSVVMSEVACEGNMLCDRDQDCFKGLVSAWLSFITYLVPQTTGKIMPLLQGSANAAGKQCSGGSTSTLCGRRWWQPTWDGSSSLEEEMSVLNLFSACLTGMTGGAPLTAKSGGNSSSNPGEGGDGDTGLTTTFSPITTADRAGAGILTALSLIGTLSFVVWLVQ